MTSAPKQRLFETTPERSRIMSRVRSRYNKSTELRMVAALKVGGIKGWRRHAQIAGRPDFVFRGQKVAVFVDGCFWHGCPACYKAPAKNAAFWSEKVQYVAGRDRRVTRELRASGWTVIRVWEHALRDPDAVARRVRRAIETR